MVPRGSGPAAAEAWRKMKSWSSQVDLAKEFKKGISFSHSLTFIESELLDGDVLSLTSSDPVASALLDSYPAYAELLEVLEPAMVRLDFP